MAKTSLKKVSAMMKGLDLCMLVTTNGRGQVSSRPMSNNGEVDYDGTSYFFTWAKSRMVKEIKAQPNVGLTFTQANLLSKLFISVTGKARLSKDKLEMQDHWSKDLEIWFRDGIDTPGIMMIAVEAKHIKFWSQNKEGEVDLSKR